MCNYIVKLLITSDFQGLITNPQTMNTHRFTELMSAVLLIVFFSSCCAPKSLTGGGGCGFTNFSGSDAESWETGSRLDLFVGLPLLCEDIEPVQLTPILSYQKRGADFSDTFTDGMTSYSYEEKLRLNYIYLEPEVSTPIITDNLEVVVAPQVGFLINATEDIKTDFDDTKETVTDDFNTLDFGLRGGLRYNITDRFSAGAHYYQGFTNVQDEFNAKNNGFHVRLEYKIKSTF